MPEPGGEGGIEGSVLKIEDLEVAYGDIQVLWRVSLEVGEGEIVALVGSNGAGKTTLLNTIAGLLKPLGGEIRFDDREIGGLSPDERVRLGISLVPEGRQLFLGMSVKENLLMGAYARKDREKIREDLKWAYDLFPQLKEREEQLAGTLSGGEQQMCAIGRGLMSRPKILLIDELSLGLAPMVVDRLVKVIEQICREGRVTIFLVEQDVRTAFELADKGYVMETGRIVMKGVAKRLLANRRVKEVYLGM